MNLRETIQRELRLAFDHGKVSREGVWPGADRDQVAEIGTERIEQAIQIDRESSAANVAARVAAEAQRSRDLHQLHSMRTRVHGLHVIVWDCGVYVCLPR